MAIAMILNLYLIICSWNSPDRLTRLIRKNAIVVTWRLPGAYRLARHYLNSVRRTCRLRNINKGSTWSICMRLQYPLSGPCITLIAVCLAKRFYWKCLILHSPSTIFFSPLAIDKKWFLTDRTGKRRDRQYIYRTGILNSWHFFFFTKKLVPFFRAIVAE